MNSNFKNIIRYSHALVFNDEINVFHSDECGFESLAPISLLYTDTNHPSSWLG